MTRYNGPRRGYEGCTSGRPRCNIARVGLGMALRPGWLIYQRRCDEGGQQRDSLAQGMPQTDRLQQNWVEGKRVKGGLASGSSGGRRHDAWGGASKWCTLRQLADRIVRPE